MRRKTSAVLNFQLPDDDDDDDDDDDEDADNQLTCHYIDSV